MDLIRSCYIGTMVFSEGGPPVLVRWYRCGPLALPYPGQHCFGSLNDDDTAGSPLIGEQRGPKVWDAGMRPAGLNGNDLIGGTRAEFEQGSPLAPRLWVYSVAVEPSLQLCRGPLSAEEDASAKQFFWKHECGRVRFAETAKLGGQCEVVSPCATFPLDPICDCCVPLTLFAHFHETFACPDLRGKVVKITRPLFSVPTWEGSIALPSSPTGRLWVAVTNNLDGTATPWEIQWDVDDTFSGSSGQTGQDFAQCDEFELQFNNGIDDTFCSPGTPTIVLVNATSGP